MNYTPCALVIVQEVWSLNYKRVLTYVYVPGGQGKEELLFKLFLDKTKPISFS